MEECTILGKLGKEVGLDMLTILVRTNMSLFEKAVAQNIPSSKSFEITPNEDPRYDLFFRALDWLLVDDNLILEAIRSANETIIYFLSKRKIYAADKVLDAIPPTVYQKLVLKSRDENVSALDLNRRVIMFFKMYPEWENLLASPPTDS